MWDKVLNRLPKEHNECRLIGLNLHMPDIQLGRSDNILELLKEIFCGDRYSRSQSNWGDMRRMSLSYSSQDDKQALTKPMEVLCQETTTKQLQLESLSLCGFDLHGLFHNLAQKIDFSRLRDFTLARCMNADVFVRELGHALKDVDSPLRHVQVEVNTFDCLDDPPAAPKITSAHLCFADSYAEENIADFAVAGWKKTRKIAPRLRSLGLHYQVWPGDPPKVEWNSIFYHLTNV